MNILVDIGHPGHVHLLKNLLDTLENEKHKIIVTVKDIPIAIKLLEYYGIDYINLGKKQDSIFGKLFFQLKYNWSVGRLVWKNKIALGIGTSMTIAHVSKFSKMASIVLDDDDDDAQPLFVKYAHPFADVILSPDALVENRRSNKTTFYPSYHELAYLHPNRFKPDLKVLEELGLKENDTFFILRFNVFKAHHDVGISGLNLAQKLEIVNLLKPLGRIFITTEREIEAELKEFQMPVAPEKIHSLLYYATMFVGDSQTMTSEAALLGTPAVKLNSFAGKLSIPNEIENKYGLCYSFLPTEYDNMLAKIKELIATTNLKGIWKKKKEEMLKDKVDLSTFLISFVTDYSNSTIKS